MSPLAEGRELKYYICVKRKENLKSPLAEGRELKYILLLTFPPDVPVAPRGGA